MSSHKAAARDHSPVRLSPVSCLVLGLIGLRGPSTPYELKRAVGRSVSYFWPFPHSQLYGEPERLAEAGLLSRKTETGGRRRKLYKLTRKGEQAQGGAERDLRNAGHGGPAAVLQRVHEQGGAGASGQEPGRAIPRAARDLRADREDLCRQNGA